MAISNPDDCVPQPRLIASWNGRVVNVGMIHDPNYWFMPAGAKPEDFTYVVPDDDVKPDHVVGD